MGDHKPIFEGWAIIELFGHRRLAGWVTEVEAFGSKFLRIDIPKATAQHAREDSPTLMVSDSKDSDGWSASQLYGAAAIYCITPTTAEVALAAAKSGQPSPVQRWEMLPMREVVPNPNRHYEDDDDDFDDADEDHEPPF